MSTYFYARARRSQGAWLEAITGEHLKAMPEELRDQLRAMLTDTLAGLKDRTIPAVLVAVDSPQPTRAYALLVRVGRQEVVGYAHALDGATDDVYRALFSGMAVQASLLGGGPSVVALTPITSSPTMLEAADRLGAPYAVVAGPAPSEAAEEDDTASSVPPAGDESNGVEGATGEPGETAETPAEAAAQGDLEEHAEFFEERGVDLSDGELSEEEALALLEAEEAEEDKSETVNSELTCSSCGKSFKNRAGLASHMKSHE